MRSKPVKLECMATESHGALLVAFHKPHGRRFDMPNDTTLKSVFDYAKQGPLSSGDFPEVAAVYATLVEHSPNSQPPGGSTSADLVTYASGPMTLSGNKKILSGEFKRWRNVHYPGSPAIFGSTAVPEDAFADVSGKGTVLISVSDTGQVTYQPKINGKPIGGQPPKPLNATYENGLFVEKSTGGVKSLSFTLGVNNS